MLKKRSFKSLRREVIVGLLIAFFELIFVTYIISEFFLMRGILEVEKQYAYDQIELFGNAILTETQKLVMVTSDWAPWNATYEFMLTRDQTYIENNLMDEAFVILDLDYFLYINTEGEYVFEKGYDLQRHEEIPVPSSLHEQLEKLGVSNNHNPNAKWEGIILLPEGPVLIATHPILTSNFEGPIRGNLVAVRLLNPFRVNQIAEKFMLDLVFDTPIDGHLQFPMIENIDSKTLLIHSTMVDIEGNPSVGYAIEMNREASQVARNTVHLLIVSLLIAFIVVAIGNLIMLDRRLLVRLLKLSHDVKNIRTEGDFSNRFNHERRLDEISIVKDELNLMLDKLEESQASLAKSEEKYRTLVEKGTDVLYSINHKGFIAYISPNCLKEIGYDPLYLTGKSFEDIMHPNDRMRWREAFDRMLTESAFQFELEFRLKKQDSNWHWFYTKLTKSNQSCSSQLKFIGILYDDDKRKKAEEGMMMILDRQENVVQERTAELLRANESLIKEITERKKIQQKINYLAYHDHLTGLPNRLGFKERLLKAIEQAQSSKKMIGIVFLDLDSFKIANDTLGHDGGNELIKAVGNRISDNIREYDVLSRVSGDEFLIMIQNISHREDMIQVLEGIISLFKTPFQVRDKDFMITASAGVTLYPEDGLEVEELIKNADIAMYFAKNNGKNRYFFLTESLIKDAEERLKITGDLYHAMENDELRLFYQPQIDAVTGDIVGMEALLRWQHPKMGWLSPNYFIPIAEATGLIQPIGEWVLRTACEQNKLWQEMGLPKIRVAVNMSIQQFCPDVASRIAQILEETQLSPEDLEIEITEGILIKETELVVDTLKALKKLGVTISIDDFGTEYSSLCRLRQLPIDRIKIDMNFVQGIGVDFKDEAIVKSIILLAQSMELKVIAEGVETLMQMQFLEQFLTS